MAQVRLSTLGRLELTRDGSPVLARRRKELALLAYLARRGPRPVDRAVLASLLWGARGDDAKAKVSLRQALFDLREALGEIVQTDSTTVRVNPQHLDLDIASFEAAVAAGRLADAAALWHGPFMDGLEDLGGEDWVIWVESERTALNAKLGVALAQLADAAEADGDRPAALRWAERCLEALPHEESAAIRLVMLYLRAGRTADAKGTVAGYTERLRRDLDTGPSAALLKLVSDDARPALGKPGYRGLVSPDLAGRDNALALLTRAWAAAAGGAGRAVLIEGDEGSGKSKLVEVFAAQLSALRERPPVFLGRAFPTERAQAWSTLRPLLARVFATGRGMAAAPPDALASAATVVPELRERFPATAFPDAGHHPGAAIVRILSEMVTEQPLALLIDDAPAADAESTAVLAELVRRPPPGLLLVLAGRRDAWARSAIGAEHRDSPNVADRIELGPLSVAEAATLIGSMAPFDPASRGALAERLRRETGGNPGQLVRFVQQLADEGRIAPRPDGLWIVEDAERPIPLESGVRDLMRTRLAELTEPARRLVEAAAVLGPTIDPRLLETVSRLNPAEYRDTLGTVLTRRLLRESASRVGQFEFPSEANRRAVYDQIVPSTRAGIHREAANALARHPAGAGPVKEEIARHRQLAGPGRSRLFVGLVGIGALVVGVVGATIVRTRRAARVEPGTPVLVATFKNTTGETDFDGSLQTAAEIGLQESGHVWLLPKNRIADALQRGGRLNTDTIVDGPLALEVAVRENVPVVIELALAKPGNEYLVTGKIVRTSTGADLRSFQTRIKTRELVLDGLSGVVADIRRALGEADSLRRPATELPALTTRSILALKLYADGEAAWNRRDWTLAWSQLQRAVVLDSTFAMAHVLLAREALIRQNNRPMAIEYLAAARRWSGHLTGREQLVLEIEEAMIRGDTRRAAEITELLAARFPSPTSLSNYAFSLFRSNRCAEAVPLYRRALGMAPRMTASWINLASCYQLLDSLPAALAAYAEAERVDSTILIRDNLNQEWGRVFVRMGRLAAADSAFRRMLSQPERMDQARGHRSLGYLAMTRGDYRTALGEFGDAGAAFEAANNPLGAARSETMATQAAAALGDEGQARGRLAKPQALLRDFRLEPAYHLYLGLTHLRVGDRAGAKAWLTRLDGVIGPGGESDTTIRNLLEARIAIAEGRFARARALLPARVPAAVSYLEPVALDTRGRVYLGLGLADSALAVWRRAQATFTWGTEIQDDWERLPLSIAEAALATGDSSSARRALSEILERWKTAPYDFPDLRRARERLKNLQSGISR